MNWTFTETITVSLSVMYWNAFPIYWFLSISKRHDNNRCTVSFWYYWYYSKLYWNLNSYCLIKKWICAKFIQTWDAHCNMHSHWHYNVRGSQKQLHGCKITVKKPWKFNRTRRIKVIGCASKQIIFDDSRNTKLTSKWLLFSYEPSSIPLLSE